MNKLRIKKKLKTKKKRFEETDYTFDPHRKAMFKSYLSRIGINEFNYRMVTVNCPLHIDIRDKQMQLDFLSDFLKSLKFKYVACCEWSDQRANGYHLHIIISREDLDLNLHLFSDDTCYESELLVDNSLDRCLGYITKERTGCTGKNRKEKFYFSNIQERKLVSIGVRPVIKEEAPNQVIEEAIEHAFKYPRVFPNKKFKVFFKAFLNKVKTFISGLFIKKKERFDYVYKKETALHSTRDGPA
jgi:hypothetical protein